MNQNSLQQAAIITFGDGSLAYRRAGKRLISQTLKFPQFEYGLSITRKMLSEKLPFESKKINWRAPFFGYYAWKPLALIYALQTLPKGIGLIYYADAGCWGNFNSRSEKKLESYLNQTQQCGGLTFSSGSIEKWYSKQELISVLEPETNHLNSMQLSASQWIFTREVANQIAFDWWFYASQYDLVNEKFNPKLQDIEFAAPRHDQSIFSLLVKRQDFPMASESIDIHPHHNGINEEENQMPIWTARHRSGSYSLSMNPFVRFLRAVEQSVP